MTLCCFLRYKCRFYLDGLVRVPVTKYLTPGGNDSWSSLSHPLHVFPPAGVRSPVKKFHQVSRPSDIQSFDDSLCALTLAALCSAWTKTFYCTEYGITLGELPRQPENLALVFVRLHADIMWSTQDVEFNSKQLIWKGSLRIILYTGGHRWRYWLLWSEKLK